MPNLETLFSLIDQRLTLTSQRTRQAILTPAEITALTGTHIYYLHAIQMLGNPTLTDLAGQFNVTKPSVTAIVNKLIEMGYLERNQSSEDLRVYHLQLTEAGKRVVGIKDETFHVFADQIRATLTANETAELERLLAKALQAPDEG